MPTYAELRAEHWWGRELVTPEFAWFNAEVATALGVPAANVGSKGDNKHLNGAHRSQEWILNSRYCTNRTYTVQSGLTPEQARHLAGCDITPKSREQMLAICRNLDRVVRAGQLEEIREWYGNTDGDQRVDGWNNVANRVATSDSSHLWHLHLTFDRRVLRDTSVMRRVLAALLGTTNPAGDDMANADDVASALAVGITSAGYYHATAPAAVRNAAGVGEAGLARASILAVQQHLDQVDAVLAELKARPAGEITVSADLMKALGNQVLANIAPLLEDAVAAAVDQRVEAALRRVLGGLDGATPTA